MKEESDYTGVLFKKEYKGCRALRYRKLVRYIKTKTGLLYTLRTGQIN